jgi:tetratricopeptide (TPR) repeat protein
MLFRSRLNRMVPALVLLSLPGPLAAQTEPVKTPVEEKAATIEKSPSTLPPRQAEELRGDIFMAKKEYSLAVLSYQKALQLEPRSAPLLNKVGIAYHQQNMLGQAKKYYDRAVKADKTYPFAVNNLGMIQYNKKNFRQAAKLFERAVVLRNDVAAMHSNLGHSYFALKRYDEAVTEINRALALDPQVFDRRSGGVGSVLQDRSVEDRGKYYFFLARAFAGLSNAERCAQYLRKAHDEGYKGIAAIGKDPAFASVISDPLVQEVVMQLQTVAGVPRT